MAKKKAAPQSNDAAGRKRTALIKAAQAALRRDEGRLRNILAMTKRIARLDESVESALVQTARAVVAPRGWTVVMTKHLRELEQDNERMTAEINEYRAERTEREERAAEALEATGVNG